jgi:transposase
MIVIGVDVHEQSLTAAAVDETGRLKAERTLSASGGDRLCAVEDCRHVTGALERDFVAAGERLVHSAA